MRRALLFCAAPLALVLAGSMAVANPGMEPDPQQMVERLQQGLGLSADEASEVAEVPESVEEVASPETSASEEEAEQVSQLARLDAELRERIPPSPLDLRGGPDDLESALLIELSNMKLGPVKVSAPVVSWTGARNDVVEVADVEVRLTSSGSIERELAAVGLVLGKYLQHYGFEVRTFSVIVIGQDGISRKRQMEPVSARHLWSGRKDLYEFLTGR